MIEKEATVALESNQLGTLKLAEYDSPFFGCSLRLVNDIRFSFLVNTRAGLAQSGYRVLQVRLNFGRHTPEVKLGQSCLSACGG